MAASSHSSHDHDHDPHDWDSPTYVSNWAEGQDPKEVHRQEAFSVLANTIPYDKAEPIKILDLGAGYGALTKFLLERFPNATAICQDGSQEMAKLGHQRMKEFNGRFEYVLQFCQTRLEPVHARTFRSDRFLDRDPQRE